MYLLNSRSNRMPLYKYWQLVILPNLSNLLLEGGGGTGTDFKYTLTKSNKTQEKFYMNAHSGKDMEFEAYKLIYSL